MFKLPPISLYIHIPWCLKKCGYCDFYSYVSRDTIPEKKYVFHLLKNLKENLYLINQRTISSIFIGGGTPSLLQENSIKKLLFEIKSITEVSKTAEITIEANPKKLEYQRFRGYKEAGINRFSIGIQTFNSDLLKKIERTYNQQEAVLAIKMAKKISSNFNLDIMYGLPEQSLENALLDLKYTIQYHPTHISWYQFTVEPNTAFYARKHNLPNESTIFKMFIQGNKFLKKAGYRQYEISSYSKSRYTCKHNLNYWNFGDYLGIGCNAHSKITKKNGDIIRIVNNKSINDFINGHYLNNKNIVLNKDKPFEYFMNTLRLYKPILKQHFYQRTNISLINIQESINKAIKKGYIKESKNFWQTTKKGKIFLNSLLKIFLN